jgi:hypothetical protein
LSWRISQEFESRLSQHEAMIAQQKEQLKNDIYKRLAEYNGGFEKFAARWHQLKPAVRQNDPLFEPR